MLIDDTWNFWFSFLGAIGSVATAAAFGFIIHQTRLTKEQMAQTQKQISQTQEELDNTLRPWISHLQTKEKDIEVYAEFIDTPNTANPATTVISVKYFLKNYGRVPARITSKRYKWSKKEISKNDLYSEEIPVEWSSSRLQTLLFPDQDGRSTVYSNEHEQSFLVSPGETFYFGLLVDYDSGKDTKKRQYGSIFWMKDPPYCLHSWTE